MRATVYGLFYIDALKIETLFVKRHFNIILTFITF
jgi:hypothetical protein